MKDTQYLIDNISSGKFGNGKTFLEIIFRVTKICNQKCEFCFVDMTNHIYSHDFILQEFERIVNQYQNIDILVIQLSGGEPMIHPQIWSLINHFYKKGKNTKISIQTNAVFFSFQKNIESLKLVPNDLLNFFVSFHSHKEEVYNQITGSQNQYPKALAGIKNLCKNKNNLAINIVMNKYNLEYFDEYLEFFKKEFLSINPNIKLNISVPSILPEGKEYLYIKFSDLVDKINKNFDLINENKINISNLYGVGSDCDLPFCMTVKINGAQEKLKYINSYFVEKKLAVDRIKFDTCKNCRFNNICNGILKSYIDIFGKEEFNPVILD